MSLKFIRRIRRIEEVETVESQLRTCCINLVSTTSLHWEGVYATVLRINSYSVEISKCHTIFQDIERFVGVQYYSNRHITIRIGLDGVQSTTLAAAILTVAAKECLETINIIVPCSFREFGTTGNTKGQRSDGTLHHIPTLVTDVAGDILCITRHMCLAALHVVSCRVEFRLSAILGKKPKMEETDGE